MPAYNHQPSNQGKGAQCPTTGCVSQHAHGEQGQDGPAEKLATSAHVRANHICKAHANRVHISPEGGIDDLLTDGAISRGHGG
jgi:hypothetical protein